MNIPSVPGGNGPIFDTRYCRRKILQNLVRGIGWLASAKFGPAPATHDHPSTEGQSTSRTAMIVRGIKGGTNYSKKSIRYYKAISIRSKL